MPAPPQIKFLAGKSLFVSVFLHWVVFNVFLFVLPVYPQPHKPNFIFLGSILSRSDVIVPINPLPGRTQEAGDHFISSMTPRQLYDAQIDKPAPRTNASPENKRTIKLVTPQKNEEPPESPPQYRPDTKIEIELDIEPYKPLRSRSHD